MLKYVVFGLSIIFNAFANILMKYGVNSIGKGRGTPEKSIIILYLFNPFIWLGVVSFGAALICYSYVLSKFNVSIAYPVNTSLGIVIVIIISALFLNEKITLMQSVGFILIFAGVWLVAR